MAVDEEKIDFKEENTSKSFFGDFLPRKSTPPATKDRQTLAQDMFKRRTISSGNLFPTRPKTPGRKEFQRSSSQDQPKQSLFQIFSRKQEPIDEA